MEQRPQIAPEQQEYRDNLAHDLKELRQYGNSGKALARVLLENEREKKEYKESTTSFVKEKAMAEKEFEEELTKKVKKIIKSWFIKDKYERLYVLINEIPKGTILHNDIVEILIDTDDLDMYKIFWVLTGKCILKGLTKETAKKIFNATDINVNREVSLMFSSSHRYFENYLNCFVGLDEEIFLKLFKRDSTDIRTLFENLSVFEGLTKKTAIDLIDYDVKYDRLGALAVAKNPDSFVGLDEEVARRLIDAGYGSFVVKHPEKYGLKKEM